VKGLAIVVALLVVVGAVASRGFDWWTLNVGTPVSQHSVPVAFTVSTGEGASEVGDGLKAKGLIRSTLAFDLYTRQSGTRGKLQAGTFVLNKDMAVPALVAALEHGHANQLAVRLLEGDTMVQMSQLVQAAGLGSASAYVSAAEDPSWTAKYPFLQNRPPGSPQNLEGFLFPDTYLVNQGSGPTALIQRQLDEFGQQFSPALQAQAAQSTSVRPAESIFNIVTLASIVEREVNQPPDRALACDVFYNRLAQGIPLGSDATIEYAIGQWNANLTPADLANPSPFNTRLHAGLPPGPISNPSLASIKACIEPKASTYLFFFIDAKGVTRFSSSDAEFTQQQQQYGLAGG